MMGSLYIGASGMVTHSAGMSVVTNNLANANTVGYKQNTMLFADMVSQAVSAGSNTITNMSQRGSGAMVGSTRTVFTQMAFETSNIATDIGIEGVGFFGVMHKGQMQYTRAGDFHFTKDGYMVDPSGWNLMGYAINGGKESTALSEIQLDLSNTKGSPGVIPSTTTSWMNVFSQLGGVKDSQDGTAANPFFSMASAYDGTSENPLGSQDYSYKEPIQFYDSNGTLQQAMIYYDLAGQSNGQKAIEYVIALPPDKDGSGLAGTNAAGLLMAGTLTFSSTGDLQNMTAFTPPASGDPSDLSGWLPASLQNGSPVLNISVKGAEPQSIALNMGLTLNGSSSAGLDSAADAATSPDAIYSPNTSAKAQAKTSTAYGESCGSLGQQRDGYAEGYLYNLEITQDGIIRGRYSNGESEDLYRIPLFRFTSQDGLRREGSNRFSSTPESGEGVAGRPGDENFGTLAQYSLEQSNVDYTREFTNMIITQRGFQMNSKVVTTSDTMLQKALELKNR